MVGPFTAYHRKIEECVGKHADMLLRVAFMYVKNISDAEDIVQEVFLRLVKEYPPFESEEHEKAWLIRVAVNLNKNRLKTAWFRKTEPIHDMCGQSDLPDAAVTFSVEEKFVVDAVMQLPPKYRNVILLYYHEGYSIREISRILGKKESTVSSQLQRARARLKSILKEDFDHEGLV